MVAYIFTAETMFCFVGLFFNPQMGICFYWYLGRKEGRESERDKYWCETSISCFLHVPYPGIEPATWVYALTGNGTSILWDTSTNWATCQCCIFIYCLSSQSQSVEAACSSRCGTTFAIMSWWLLGHLVKFSFEGKVAKCLLLVPLVSVTEI